MQRRWIVPGLVAGLAVASPFLPVSTRVAQLQETGISGPQPQQLQPVKSGTVPADSCLGTLAAWEFPEVIPEYWVWEQFFKDVNQPASPVLGATGLALGEAGVLKEKAAQAITNAATARRAGPALVQAEADAAEAIISARDDLKRQLPDSSLRAAISKVYEQASQREYTLPVMGKPEDVGGTTRCIVSVKGRECG